MTEASYYLVKWFRKEDGSTYRDYDYHATMRGLHKEADYFQQLPVDDPRRPFKMSVQVETVVEYELYNEED